MKKIVVKVGSQSLTNSKGEVSFELIEHLVKQIVELESFGYRVILITSGAVAVGRGLYPNFNTYLSDVVEQRQVLSSLGQASLISFYQKFLKEYDYHGAQILLTKEDFQSHQQYVNILRLFQGLFKMDRVLPIINENDTTSVQELMFSDNDELSTLIAALVESETLVLLTESSGVFDRPPQEDGALLIPIWDIDKRSLCSIVAGKKTPCGRGGIANKIRSCERAVRLGIQPYIACANEPNVLRRLIHDGESLGTSFIGKKTIHGIKKWLSYVHSPDGAVTVFDDFSKILREKSKATSILPINIHKVHGIFEKGDVVAIKTRIGNVIGVGIAEYDSIELEEYLRQHGKPHIIHYDRIHIFNDDMIE